LLNLLFGFPFGRQYAFETMTQDDSSLIKEFVANHSQAAFTTIVQRYVDFVYSAALRQVNGDSGMASDICQSVFVDLGRRASSLSENISLPGWLHRATRLTALAALRTQRRRIVREREAILMQEIERMDKSLDWNSVRDVIDAALDSLNKRDREAVLLRYFQKQSFRDISTALHVSEDAARMRVERSLEKLRAVLAKNGVTSTSAALSVALTAQSVASAPAGLSLSIAQAASVACIHSSLTSALTIMATTKLKLGIAAIIAAGAIAGATHEHLTTKQLEAKLASLDSQDNSATEITPAKSTSLIDDELSKMRQEHLELMRLRGEVAELRKNQTEATRLAATTAQPEPKPDEEPSDPVQEANKTAALARMNYTTGWGIAFILFAQENGGMMPKTFAEAAKHYPAQSAPVMSAFDPAKFEIVFNGSLKEVVQPEKTIIVREKEAFPNGNRTGFARTYLFADGHTEIHSSSDGNFEPWEKPRLASTPFERGNQ